MNALRVFLGPFTLGLAVVIMAYSGTLASFLAVDIMPKPIDKIQGVLP